MNAFSVLALLSCFVQIQFGLHVFHLERRSTTHRLFLLTCLSFAVWAFFHAFVYPIQDPQTVWPWFRLSALGWCTAPAVSLHFMISLTRRESRRPLSPALWLPLYAPAAVLLGRAWSGVLSAYTFVPTPFGMAEVQNTTSPWYLAHLAYTVSYYALFIALAWRWGRGSCASSPERGQSRTIVLYSAVALNLCLLTNIVLPILRLHWLPGIAPILVLIWTYGIRRAIVHHKLLHLNDQFAADTILASISDLLLLVAPDGSVLQINEMARRFLGRAPDYFTAHRVDTLFQEDGAVRRLLQEVAADTATRRMNVNAHCVDGMIVPLALTATAIRNVENTVIGIVLLLHDIREKIELDTALHRLEKQHAVLQQQKDELESAYSRLEELDRLKSDFVSSVSHELRTPLTSVIGFTKMVRKDLAKARETLADGAAPAQKHLQRMDDNLRIVCSEGEHLTGLIEQLLDMARLESRHADWHESLENLNEVLFETVLICRRMFGVKPHIRFLTEIEENLGCIWVDRNRLIQVVTNLVANAVKFTDTGHIKLRAGVQPHQVRIEVQDTGRGLRPEEREQVFAKFHQVGDAAGTKPQGAGLGLALCKEIVEKYNGSIGVESEPGKGSTFYFVLPRLHAEKGAERPASGSGA